MSGGPITYEPDGTAVLATGGMSYTYTWRGPPTVEEIECRITIAEAANTYELTALVHSRSLCYDEVSLALVSAVAEANAAIVDSGSGYEFLVRVGAYTEEVV